MGEIFYLLGEDLAISQDTLNCDAASASAASPVYSCYIPSSANAVSPFEGNLTILAAF